MKKIITLIGVIFALFSVQADATAELCEEFEQYINRAKMGPSKTHMLQFIGTNDIVIGKHVLTHVLKELNRQNSEDPLFPFHTPMGEAKVTLTAKQGCKVLWTMKDTPSPGINTPHENFFSVQEQEK